MTDDEGDAPELDGQRPALSPLVLHEGKLGRWYREWPDGATPEQIESFSGSSIGNDASFWLHKKDLLQAILEAGFPTVLEQYDFLGAIDRNPYIARNWRSMFLGVR